MSIYIQTSKKSPVFYVALSCAFILVVTGFSFLMQEQDSSSVKKIPFQAPHSLSHPSSFHTSLPSPPTSLPASAPTSWLLTPEQKQFMNMEESDLAHDFALFKAYGFDVGSSLSSYYASAFQVAYALHQEGASEKYAALFLQLKNPVFFTFLMERVFDFETWDTMTALQGHTSASPALQPMNPQEIELLTPNQRLDILQNPQYHAIFLRNMAALYPILKEPLRQQSLQYTQTLDQISPNSLTHEDKYSLSEIPPEELDAYLAHSHILTSRYLYRPAQDQIDGAYQNLMTILTHESDLPSSLRDQQIQALQTIYSKLQ